MTSKIPNTKYVKNLGFSNDLTKAILKQKHPYYISNINPFVKSEDFYHYSHGKFESYKSFDTSIHNAPYKGVRVVFKQIPDKINAKQSDYLISAGFKYYPLDPAINHRDELEILGLIKYSRKMAS